MTRRLVAREFGEPERVLAVADGPDDPPPGPGEVRVAVAAAGLNFLDVMLCRGEYPQRPEPPFTPGVELAGRVVALVAGVPGVRGPAGLGRAGRRSATTGGPAAAGGRQPHPDRPVLGRGVPQQRPAAVAAAYRELFALHAAGAVRPPVTRVVPLEAAPAALADLAARRTTGKLVVQIGGES